MTFDGFARAELENFFRRQEERGKFYCSTCLVVQLTRRGARKVVPVAWTAAIEEAFVQPGRLPVRFDRPCEACKKHRPTIGVEPLNREVSGQEIVGSLKLNP